MCTSARRARQCPWHLPDLPPLESNYSEHVGFGAGNLSHVPQRHRARPRCVFMVEPAEAVIVSANSHLKTATGGAHDVTRVAGPAYQAACAALLQDHADGSAARHRLADGRPWPEVFPLTAGKRQVIQATTLRYFDGERIPATPDIVYHGALGARRSPSPTRPASKASRPTSGPSATATALLDQPRWLRCSSGLPPITVPNR
jgi:hypothetical protein